jgi:hypothetical protein
MLLNVAYLDHHGAMGLCCNGCHAGARDGLSPAFRFPGVSGVCGVSVQSGRAWLG